MARIEKNREKADKEDLKKNIIDLVCTNMTRFKERMMEIDDPKKYCDIQLKLMEFVIPKVSAIDMNANIETDSVADALTALTTTSVAAGNEFTKNGAS